MSRTWTFQWGSVAVILVAGLLASCTTKVGLEEFAFECGPDTECPQGLSCAFPTDEDGNQLAGAN